MEKLASVRVLHGAKQQEYESKMQNVTKRTFEIEECKSEAERIEIELKEAERDQITVDREKGQIAGKLEGFYA